MESISACIVAYNEEELIGRCIQSLIGSVDEIILVHDGPCNDRTLEIARDLGATVFQCERVGEAEPHRVFAIENATGDWILQIDADEFLSDELRANIKSLVDDTSCDGYEFLWPLWDGEKYVTKMWPYKAALFRRSNLKYIAFPHEPLMSNGVVRKSDFILEHKPRYNNYSNKALFSKKMKWAKVQAQYALLPFSSIPKFNWGQENWPIGHRIRYKTPYLFPIWGLYCFIQSLRSGAINAGRYGLISAAHWGIYNGATLYFVMLLKLKNRRIV